MADGTLTIDTAVNEKGIEVGVKDIEASMKRMASTADEAGNKTRSAVQKQMDAISELNDAIKETSKTASKAEKQEFTITRAPEVNYDYDGPLHGPVTVSPESLGYSKEAMEAIEAISQKAEVSEEHIADLNAELQKLKERQKELAKAGVGLGYEEFDRNTARIAEINDELKNYKKEITGAEEKNWLKELGENAEISEEHIVELNAELQKLKERQGELGKAGIGLGYEEFDHNAARIAEINAELKEYQREVSNAEAKSGPLASMCEKLDRMSSRLAQKGICDWDSGKMD